MTTKIKNCGLTTAESLRESIRTGAHFAGFIHHESSSRHLPLSAIADLVATAGAEIKTVAVIVSPSDDLLHAITTQVKPHYIQLHGVESFSRLAEIRTQFTTPLIHAMSVRTKNDLTMLAVLEEICDHILFDAQNPGSGSVFDWSLLRGLALTKPWFLAGGLTPENVAGAIRATHAPMVDVSSGIESAPGIKSLEKIAAFNAAVLHASHA